MTSRSEERTRHGFRGVARNMIRGSLLESFFVAAVVSLLAIRVFLQVTGFPQLGGGGLHIAHLLWGGLFMLVALVLLLTFLGRRVQHLAAILGGIGFGTFIDELGKFITSDNNYLFRPTLALIYVIFVTLFLTFRLLERRGRYSQPAVVANALDQIKEAVLDQGSGATDVGDVVRLLRASPAADPLVAALADALERVGAASPPTPGGRGPIAGRTAGLSQGVVTSSWFATLVVLGLLAAAALEAPLIAVLAVGPIVAEGIPVVMGGISPRAFAQLCLLASSFLFVLLVVLGVLSLRRTRLRAYQWLRWAVLISILLVQVFLFYSQQLGAVVGALVNLVVLVALNALIAAERGVRPTTGLVDGGQQAGGHKF